jgi:predicted protein tyrosine phosphatase
MDILITGHQGALYHVREKPGYYDLLFITSPRMPFGCPGTETILEQGRSGLMLQFDDINGPFPDMTEPRREHVEAALAWSRDKSNFLVACQAGISRSSGMAVVLRASRMPITEALNILDPMIHHPNQLVVRLGEEVLGVAGLVDAVSEWKRFHRQAVW